MNQRDGVSMLSDVNIDETAKSDSSEGIVAKKQSWLTEIVITATSERPQRKKIGQIIKLRRNVVQDDEKHISLLKVLQ